MDRTANELGLHGRWNSRYAGFSLRAQYALTEINNELMASKGFRRLGDTDDAGHLPAEWQ